MDSENRPALNATVPIERPPMDLVDIIDFKWLMASEGLRVHVERLQNDPAYALACLDRADASPHHAVRESARRLRCGLGLSGT